MTNTPPFKVGEPVWVKVDMNDHGIKLYEKWQKGFIQTIGKDGNYFIKGCGMFSVSGLSHQSRLNPRPTLMWTVREWVRGLV